MRSHTTSEVTYTSYYKYLMRIKFSMYSLNYQYQFFKSYIKYYTATLCTEAIGETLTH